MIRLIEALNYRSLRYVRQPLDSFQVLVGPNASGKSTFLDVVALLGDLLNDGPAKALSDRASDVRQVFFLGQGSRFEVAVELDIPEALRAKLPNGAPSTCRYEVAFGESETGETGLLAETLWLQQAKAESTQIAQPTLFPLPQLAPDTIVLAPSKQAPVGWKKVVNKLPESGNDYFHSETSGWKNPFRLGPKKSALANLPEDQIKFPVATWLKRTLMEGVQEIALSYEAMAKASPPGAPRRFLPDGSNLPWVIETLTPAQLERWVRHLRTALPDIVAVKTIERPEDRHRYLVIEYQGGFEVPSWLVSDGTLRLLALTLLAYLPDDQAIYLIEEPENGIHPRAIETVYQSLSSTYSAQVLCATHSPVILSLASPRQVLCFAKTANEGTAIVAGSEHPRLHDWKGEVDLGTLFASGVLG